jgi:hypothetical protein
MPLLLCVIPSMCTVHIQHCGLTTVSSRLLAACFRHPTWWCMHVVVLMAYVCFCVCWQVLAAETWLQQTHIVCLISKASCNAAAAGCVVQPDVSCYSRYVRCTHAAQVSRRFQHALRGSFDTIISLRSIRYSFCHAAVEQPVYKACLLDVRL